MKFESRKDILFQLLGLALIVFLIGIVLFPIFTNGLENYKFIWPNLLIIAVVAFLIWTGLGTSYELTDHELKYKSGPLRGTIEIEKIREIIVETTLWSGLKPATARKGLLIKYDKYNEIYISPKTNESFVEKLLEMNPSIKVNWK